MMLALVSLLSCSKGLVFDGVDDYVVVPDPGGLDGGGLTLEASVWAGEGGQGRQNLIARRSPGGGNDTFTFRLRQDWGGVLELGLSNGGREWGMAGKRKVPRGAWTAVAVTHDRASRRVCLYVGGEPDTCDTSPIPPGSAADALIWLGGDPFHGPTARPLKGELRDVRIWTVVRTPAQVKADSGSPAPSGTPGLVWVLP